MYNPIRRNRNIGTVKQGFGLNNKLTIAKPHGGAKSFFESVKDYTKEIRVINDHEFLFIIEETRASSAHCCSLNDVEHIIKQISNIEYGDLRFIVFRQPKRKEEILSSAWGRLIYSYEFENEYYPAIIIDAVDLTKKLKWPKSINIDDVAELQRLREDGHKFEETKRSYVADFEQEASRNTQLYRTLPHEFGHYVHYLKTVVVPAVEDEEFEEWERRRDYYFNIPKVEKEKFAHQYADKLKKKLLDEKIIPFHPK